MLTKLSANIDRYSSAGTEDVIFNLLMFAGQSQLA
jgi:hypothetical protein